jgi:ATPase subunit of ABC transporter with duplicated ATPase domains
VTKSKGKAKSDGTEILVNARLLLKEGKRYALIGRNGSGKSTLLRAIAEKLIPGIPENQRVSILQQTNIGSEESQVGQDGRTADGRTVLQHVIDKATARGELEREISALSDGINSTAALGALRALRKLKHERIMKELFILDKDARLRSGARGMAARKALVAFEKTAEDSKASLEQTEDDISPDTIQAETMEATDLLTELQAQVEPSRMAEIETQARKILTGLGFDDAQMDKPVNSLSGGWVMRTNLATALLSETDILILDEPTNFLDLLGIMWLQRHLEMIEETAHPPTLILVSHDRDFVSVCTDLIILKDKKLEYYVGDLPSYEASRAEKKIYLAKMKDAKDKQKAKIEETIHRNIKEGKKNNDDNRLRQAKMRQRKLDDRWGMEKNEKGHRFRLNDNAGYFLTSRAEIVVPQDERGVSVLLPPPPDLRFPGPLLSLEKASFRYPGKKQPPPPLVLEDISLSVHVGDRIGILGLNGAGKSTLIHLLVDAAKPTRGTVETHPRLKLGFYSQHAVAALQALGVADPALTALALLRREVSEELDEAEVRALLGSLGLPGRLASDVALRRLSGGQLVRCALARVLWKRPQLLVLDEVTTHLDYETVAALRASLREWAGAVVLVSHDRWFVRGVVEGALDEGEEDSEEESDDGSDGEAPRRRLVYRLRQGKLVLLDGGVQQFEGIMERRVKKM